MSTYCSYEKGESMPKADALQLWAKIGVDVLYVITGQGTDRTLTPDEMMLLGSWRDSPEELRSAWLAFYRAYGKAVRKED